MNMEGICHRKAQKGAYSAHSPEPGVAGAHMDKRKHSDRLSEERVTMEIRETRKKTVIHQKSMCPVNLRCDLIIV